MSFCKDVKNELAGIRVSECCKLPLAYGFMLFSRSFAVKRISMQTNKDGESVMIVSEKGLGKCTLTSEFSTQNRGGKGVKCYKITEKTGNLVGVKTVEKDDELMLITTEGIIIRIKVDDTTLLGRVTSGVKLINLNDDVTVASIAKVVEDKSLIPPEENEEEEQTEES